MGFQADHMVILPVKRREGAVSTEQLVTLTCYEHAIT